MAGTKGVIYAESVKQAVLAYTRGLDATVAHVLLRNDAGVQASARDALASICTHLLVDECDIYHTKQDGETVEIRWTVRSYKSKAQELAKKAFAHSASSFCSTHKIQDCGPVADLSSSTGSFETLASEYLALMKDLRTPKLSKQLSQMYDQAQRDRGG